MSDRGAEIRVYPFHESYHSIKLFFECKKLTKKIKLIIFNEFYKQDTLHQNNYLMSLLHLLKVKRRRHGRYNSLAHETIDGA